MKKIFILFPIHLFKNMDMLKNVDNIFIVEEPIYFTKYKFHKLKLAFHRATLNKYYNDIANKFNVSYYEYNENYLNDIKQNDEVYFYDPVDFDLTDKIKNHSKKHKYKIIMIETLSFITKYSDLEKYYENKGHKKFMHDNSFYRWQRERLNILTPISKNAYKLSYDDENRLKFPDTQKDIFNPKINNNIYIQEAIQYVNKHFKNNIGSLDHFIYPIDHKGANKWLKNFIKTRFKLFGKYEDAISSKIKFGYHSVISPLLNIGLLTDKDVLDTVIKIKSNFYLK
jgi:deoxyribodipyrimidine photolyase-related protein